MQQRLPDRTPSDGASCSGPPEEQDAARTVPALGCRLVAWGGIIALLAVAASELTGLWWLVLLFGLLVPAISALQVLWYVVSGTLEEPLAWGPASLVAGDLGKKLAKLKAREGGNVLIPGSPTLVRSLLRGGLLDELNLCVLPVVVGSGMRLFEGISEKIGLELVESRTFGNGVLDVTYRPAKA